MLKRVLTRVAPLALLSSVLIAGPSAAEDQSILLQSTTSTANSGLYDAILPVFTDKTGIKVNVVAVGTGQAIKNAQNGDGDVLLVHARSAEEAFVAGGYGVERFDVMYNDFVIVGPAADPAAIVGGKDAVAALKSIADSQSIFASRGDNSGTHKAELRLWKKTNVDPTRASGDWYLETGSGMGATLNTAVGKRAYTLTDRGTWLGFANKHSFKVLVEGDSQLFNQYGVILVNPAKHPRVRAEKGQAFVDWLTGVEGQKAISNFNINGQKLFTPNARPGA